MKLDIVKNELYIAKFHHVTQASSVRRKIEVKGRASDGFICILGGKCHYSFDDGTFFTAEKGDIMYLANNAHYKMDVDCELYEHIFTNFSFDSDEARQSEVIKPKDSEASEALFRKLLRRYSAADTAKTADCMALVYRIYSDFINAHFGSYFGGRARLITDRAKISIAEHLSDTELSVDMLAREAEVSEVHFRKLFKSTEGISPAKFITSMRIKKAKQMLEEGVFTLEEIAFSCGFSSLPYFCRVFKEKTGMTPSLCKKELKR